MTDIEIPDFSRRQLLSLAVGVGIVIGASGFLAFQELSGISKKEAGQNVLSAVEAQSGQDYELINVERQNGLFKVNLRAPGSQVSTFYVTGDGAKVTQTLADLERTRRVALARNSLSNCLQEKNVVMFGNTSQRETQVQVQLLGGQRRVSPIYADVGKQKVLQQAVQAGVERVPAFYYNGSVIQGVKTPQQVANFTGCSFSTGQ